MKHSFRLARVGAALSALALVCGALLVSARAQTVSASPDSFVLQITSTTIPAVPTPTPSPSPSPSPSPGGPLNRDSFASDLSGNGRFVVIESNGDIGTKDPANGLNPDNSDGNTEIFLYDYAQRRIFQITNTRNALKSATASPIDPANIDVRVVNIRPMLSRDGRYIVFESNAYSDTNASASPLNFDGSQNAAALKADGNTEIFLYAVPQVADVSDLSQGADVPLTDLSKGTITRLTNTPASALPRAGATGVPPFFSDDNSTPQVSDDGSYVIFSSTRNISNLGGLSNADGNREIFIYNRTSPSFVQVTNTQDVAATATTRFRPVFSENPQISGSGTRLAFVSNADINSTETEANRGNAEIYVADFNGTVVSNLRPVTHTPPQTTAGIEGSAVNVLSPGRRLSRDGQLLGFESVADLAGNNTINANPGLYVYNIAANTFSLVINRPPSTEGSDISLRFPTFTGQPDPATGSPRVVFASDLNLKTDGTVAAANATEGLNPSRATQIFTALYNASTNTFGSVSVLTHQPTLLAALQPITSDTVRRTVFSLRGTELGGGNADGSSEAYYLLIPAVTSETPAPSPTPAASPAPVSFSTGASDRPVVTPSPTPPAVAGLAPGELGISRSTLALANTTSGICPAGQRTCGAATQSRRPSLPIELAGVSVAISNAAAGLYFVSPGQINFVVPPGLLTTSTTPLPVVINNNGAVIRTSLPVIAAQPDIFTSTNGAGGRAAVLNTTNPCVSPTGEPFAVTSTRPKGSATDMSQCTAAELETVPTELTIMLTGVRNVTRTQVTVNIGSTSLTGDAIVSVGPSQTPGFDQIVVRLPATLAGAGDVPIVVSVTIGGTTFTSRPADTAPHITIQ